MEINLINIIGVINGVIAPTFITPEMQAVNLEDFGIDSIYFIELAVALENTFEIKIPNECLTVEQLNTPQKILHVLLEITQTSSSISQVACENSSLDACAEMTAILSQIN